MGTVYSNQTQVNDMQHGRHTGRKGQERMKAKKIIPALAIVLLAVVGTLLWFRPKTATDFPPGLALKFGDFARIEVYLPDTDQLTAYYTVSLIQPSMGIFTDISTQKRWKLTGRDEIAAVAAYITQLTGQAPS